MTILKTIDAHVAGEPLRLLVDGFPAPQGKTMMEKRDWAARYADAVRRTVMLEPRGHADMFGAVLTEPVTPGSHAGVLFMHNEGYGVFCGHAIIGLTTIALERGLLMPGGDGRTVVFDTPAGTVRATATWAGTAGTGGADAPGAGGAAGAGKVTSVSFVNVPSFVWQGGVEVVHGTRRIRVDIAFGGAFYAIVDAESVGLPIDRAHLPELRRASTAIRAALDRTNVVTHPREPRLEGVYGVVFTGPPTSASADLRNVTVFADEQVDRSPCGSGTAAVMAVVEAMGLLDETRAFVHESVIGTTFRGRIAGRTVVGDYPAIIPEIEGSAWITGEHTFIADETDPLEAGFRI